MSITRVTPWLAVANLFACGREEFRACVHINRSDHPAYDCGRHSYSMNVQLDYRDGELLSDFHIKCLTPFINSLCVKKEPTLVHCYAGVTRSPTVAAYILAMVDGLHPIDAFHVIEKAQYTEREGREVCNFVYQPKIQICRLVEASRFVNGYR